MSLTPSILEVYREKLIILRFLNQVIFVGFGDKNLVEQKNKSSSIKKLFLSEGQFSISVPRLSDS